MGSKGNYIGSTDAASILGCGFRTPLQVYAELTGITPPQKQTAVMTAGLEFEPVIKRMTEKEVGFKIGEPLHWKHDEYSFIGGTDDGGSPDGETGFDFKFVTPFMEKEFTGTEAPAKYLIQMHHNLIPGRRKRFIIAAFFCSDFEIHAFEVKRDQEFCDMLLQREVDFWNKYVVPRVEPKETDVEVMKEFLKQKHPKSTAAMLPAEKDALVLMKELAISSFEKKVWEESETKIENQLKAIIGGDAGIQIEGDGKSNPGRVTWKQIRDSVAVDYEGAFREIKKDLDPTYYEPILAKHTKVVPGYRRFLKSGVLFKSSEDQK